MIKPCAPACERNREPILQVISGLFADRHAVLEIGSGTGQHAVYFAKNLPHVEWLTSDLKENHAGIDLWLEEAALGNLHPPFILDVKQSTWPAVDVDAIFSANTAHIMHWDEVEAMFGGAGEILPDKGLFVLYGPFNYGNCYTSESNAHFDKTLKERDPLSGIRNFEDLDQLAGNCGMDLKYDIEMPANNRILCWGKVTKQL